MYERLNKIATNAVAYRIVRPLNQEEMAKITAELEGEIKQSGKISVLIDLQGFPYADLGALWEDLRFDVKYAGKIKRLALVGGGKVEKWSIRIFAALTFTSCRCFGEGQVDEAWDWLIEK